jgi:alpha-tubulin suppressor-like RCC1 family protein
MAMRCPRLPIAPLLLAALAAACGDEAPSPTSPETAPVSAAGAAALDFVQVSAGVEHACGVTTDGKAWCWGANQYGELGIPPAGSPDPCSSRPCSFSPVAVSGGLRFRHISAGAQFTCGLTNGDKVFCWGRNDGGQLGTKSTAEGNFTPGRVAGDRTYRQVSAGSGAMACAISASRSAFCWGSGRLGNGTSRSRGPVKVSGDLEWAQLSVGAGFVCGITTTAGEAWCWGANGRGQLGNGTTTTSGTPVRSAEGLRIARIDAGNEHACALLADARAFCWGSRVGVGTGGGGIGRVLVPTPVGGTRKWNGISAGALHSCGVTVIGRGFCWGMGVGGALGNGSTEDRFTPAVVSGNLEFVAISASFVFSCGVAEGGKAWCWGDNSNGQLGDGTGINRLVPVAVAGS